MFAEVFGSGKSVANSVGASLSGNAVLEAMRLDCA
jgi:hypothetical protein